MPKKKKMTKYDEQVIQMHTLIFSLSFIVPGLCWLLKILEPEQCLALFGLGLFLLSGHSIAYYESYLNYLRAKDENQVFSESSYKRILWSGIIIDIMLAIMFINVR